MLHKNLSYLIIASTIVLLVAYFNNPGYFTTWYNDNEAIISAIVTVGSIITILYVSLFSVKNQ